jgi:hypothetical protein
MSATGIAILTVLQTMMAKAVEGSPTLVKRRRGYPILVIGIEQPPAITVHRGTVIEYMLKLVTMNDRGFLARKGTCWTY